MNKVLPYICNKLWSKTQNWFTQYNYLFYFKKYKDNSFSIIFYVNSKKFKQTIAISEAISTFIVFPSKCIFHLYLFCEKFQLQTVHNWHAPILLRPFSLLQCHFKWICEVYSVDARDQLTATAYSPKKIKGTQLITPF